MGHGAANAAGADGGRRGRAAERRAPIGQRGVSAGDVGSDERSRAAEEGEGGTDEGGTDGGADEGSTDEGGSTQACFGCGGRGYVRCDTCDGAGGVLGEPTVWSVLSRHREVRTLEDLGLPMDVFFALHDGASGRDTEGDGGVLIHVQEGERVHTLQRAQGYRDDARHGASSALHRAVEKLAAEPGVTGNDRIHHQRLEVRQVPVYALILRGGESVFVYGEPLQLSPTNALRTTLGKVAHTFGWS